MSKIGQYNLDLEERLAEAEQAINAAEAKLEKKMESPKTAAKVLDSEKTDWAIFKDFVESAGLIVENEKGTYLKAEGWLYLAMLKGLVPSVETKEIKNPELNGFCVKATCELLDEETGELVSQSDMFASSDEDFLKDKPAYAVYGMAETRAISRAVRNVYGYVLKGIGYESTPAVEMGLEEDAKD